MTVLAYDTFQPVGVVLGYRSFTGQVDQILTDGAEISIGDVVNDELQTLPASTDPNFGYVYTWKALLTVAPTFIASASMFKGLPPRYKIGHISASTNAGTVWDTTWRFENQVTPLFKGTFNSESPQPGDGFPFGTIPLGESDIRIWQTVGVPYSALYSPLERATFLGLFIDSPADIFVRISYTALLSFTSLDILAAAPQPFVVVYP